jgi:hypothetical protein
VIIEIVGGSHRHNTRARFTRCYLYNIIIRFSSIIKNLVFRTPPRAVYGSLLRLRAGGNRVFWLDARAISFARVLLGALGALGALDVAAPMELAAALPVPGELVRVVAPAAAQHPAPFSP